MTIHDLRAGKPSALGAGASGRWFFIIRGSWIIQNASRYRRTLSAARAASGSLWVVIVPFWACQNLAAQAETVALPPSHMTTERLLAICGEAAASDDRATIQSNRALCLGYTRGVADFLRGAGALDACPMVPVLSDTVEKLRQPNNRHSSAEKGGASQLMARLLLESCRKNQTDD